MNGTLAVEILKSLNYLNGRLEPEHFAMVFECLQSLGDKATELIEEALVSATHVENVFKENRIEVNLSALYKRGMELADRRIDFIKEIRGGIVKIINPSDHTELLGLYEAKTIAEIVRVYLGVGFSTSGFFLRIEEARLSPPYYGMSIGETEGLIVEFLKIHYPEVQIVFTS